MTKEEVLDAPLGLDFEMPEHVWVLRVPGTHRVIVGIPDGDLLAAFLSDTDATALKANPCRCGVSDPHLFHPFRASVERIRMVILSGGDLRGVVVFDGEGVEIARRYFK